MDSELPTWHLNLTRTLADAWTSGLRPAPRAKPKARKRKPRPVRAAKPRSLTYRWKKAPYAGKTAQEA